MPPAPTSRLAPLAPHVRFGTPVPVPQAPPPPAHMVPLRERLRILVVDDMSTSRGVLLQALDALGCRRVAAVADGRAALALMRRDPVDLVLSDYLMPGMDGLDLLAALRDSRRHAAVWFILCTAVQDSAMLTRARALRLDGMIDKPFSLPQLRARIETVAGRL